MAKGLHRLSLERPIYECEDRIVELEGRTTSIDEQEELRHLRRDVVEMKKRIFRELSPWETVEVARHPDRPKTSDYLSLVFDEFVELHGDRSINTKCLSSATRREKLLPNVKRVTLGVHIQKAIESRWVKCDSPQSLAFL